MTTLGPAVREVDPPAEREPAGPLRTVLANAGLRRIETAWALGVAGDAAFTVGILVAAFTIGGAVAVGVLSFIRMAPSIVGAPMAGLVAGRRAPTQLLFLVHAARAAGAGIVVLALAVGAPAVAGLLGAAIASTAGAFVRPLQVAATPAYARTPDELIATNGVTSTGEGIGAFLGPLLGAVLVATGGALPATVAGAVIFVVAAGVLAGLRPSADERAARDVADRGLPRDVERLTIGTVVRALTSGLRVARARPSVGLILIGFASQVFVRGLMTTLTVVTAIRLVGLGEPGVGTLAAAYGLGTLGGALLSVRLAGRRHLAPTFAVSLALWGLPIAVIAAVPRPEVAVVALAVSGVANGVLDVAGFTLLQRSVTGPERMAVFGLLEAIAGIGLAGGGIVAPLMIGAAGDRGALAIAGAFLPIVAVASWRRLRRVDASAILPDRELRLLRGIRLFDPLPLTALERLAEGMHQVSVGAGDVVMREGEEGDAYAIVADGRFEVRQGGRVVSALGPGEGLGEIALLRSGVRTATVVALTEGSLDMIDCDVFLAAVAGPTSAAAAAAVIDERLARAPG